jgi:biopolymer transport protein TolQ
VITILKVLQLARLRAAEERFERTAANANGAEELYGAATRHRSAPGSRVVMELASRAANGSIERMRAVADRALVHERHRASTLLSTLGSIAAAAPFVGLFGTVYGIMDAFIRIGQEKSASLPVVAPAIGEALITTAIGLAAAIPAVIFYNAIDKRVSDLIDEIEASAAEWVTLFAAAVESQGQGPVLLTRQVHAPTAAGFPRG